MRRTVLAGALLMALASTALSAQTSGTEPPPAPRPTPHRHPTLRVPHGEIQFRARVESRLLTPSDREGLDADYGWQTRRVQVEGSLFERLEFEVSHEFGDSTESERLKYVNYRFARSFEIRAGQFKIPFGRDALASGANLDFVVRSLAGRQIAPGRDVGVMVHGRTATRVVSYRAGYFRRDGDNARTPQTTGGHHALAGRVVAAPFATTSRRWLAPLQAGAAAVTSRLDNQLGLRGETVFGEGVFFDRLYVNGRRRRYGLDAAWARGPVSLSAERSLGFDERRAMGIDGEDLPGVRAAAWYVAGTWTVTGEEKDGRVEPRASLFAGGFGALQLAARVERLTFRLADDGSATATVATPGNHDRATTVGLGWYLNRYVKVQANLVFESIGDPQRSPAPVANGRTRRGVLQFQFVL